MATTREQIDSRGKSLLQLLTDNPQVNKADTNRYKHEGSQTYNDSFRNQTLDYYYPPADNSDFAMSAAQGFNLGQVLGPEIDVQTKLMEKGIVLARDFIDRMILEAQDANNMGSASYYSVLRDVIFPTVPADRVSQLFRPGWSRAQIPFNEITPLKELLLQNLLLPPDTGISAIDAGGPSIEPTLSNTYAQLYLEGNRVRQPSRIDVNSTGYQQGRYAKGAIAGTAINDLQEPLINPEGVVNVQAGKVSVPFKFDEDDNRYLTHSKKQAGFISNGPNVQSNPNAMESAIVDRARGAAYVDAAGNEVASAFKTNALDVLGVGEGQYFPFTFSTVNKKNSRIQICTLQATMQSLSESFIPTWQSKHFFGRSEQIHTYTFTDRTIDLTFVIFADSMRQLQNVYERVLWLAQQCYPDYSSENRIGGGPIIALRIGDLIQHKAGFIRSLSYDWGFLGPGGKWELTRGTVMPQACSVTLSYQIIHEKVPTRDYNFYGGPAGGLSTGMANLKSADYGPQGLTEETDIIGAGERYIPTGALANDEISYLEGVDERNAGLYDINFSGDPLDTETGLPPWDENFTGGRTGASGHRRR